MVFSELVLLYLTILIAFCLYLSSIYMSSPDNKLQQTGDYNMFMPIVVTILLTYVFGQRQLFMGGYVDTANYAREYINLEPGDVGINFRSEWIWMWFMTMCKRLGVDTQTFFTLVAAGYNIPLIFAVKKFMPTNTFLGLLFVWASLFYVPFGVNGIRNGLACHILLLGLAYLFDGKYIPCAILMFIAFGIHRSVMLPIVAAIVAVFFFKDVRLCIFFWVSSIFLSFFAGGWFISFFAGLGFDDRMTQYTTEQDMSMFSATGFRWDFLLYSSVPVGMAWYVCIKRDIADNWYNALCVIYLLCNAFWILVMQSSYSNRFAYLSWFIYPLIIAYPTIMLPAWEDQDNKTGQILLGYLGVTIMLYTLWGSYISALIKLFS